MDKRLAVYRIIAYIPKGKVVTYGAISTWLAWANPRVIGTVIHKNQNQKKFPCHRVVNAEGRVAPLYAFGGGREQKRKLETEGVRFKGDRVIMKEHLWHPSRLLTTFFRKFIK